MSLLLRLVLLLAVIANLAIAEDVQGTRKQSKPETALCAQYILACCTQSQYNAEKNSSCKHCPYPAPAVPVAVCPSTQTAGQSQPQQTTPCALFIRQCCTQIQYDAEINDSCKHCPYPAPVPPSVTCSSSVVPGVQG